MMHARRMICTFCLAVIVYPAMLVAEEEKPVTVTGSALDRKTVDAYLTGKSLGLAKVAELNNYPQPDKVLRLQQELGLDIPQINRTIMLHKIMRKYAIKAGRKIVRKEKELYQLMAQKELNMEEIYSLLKEIGSLKAEVRYEHIKAAISQKEFLSSAQLTKYAELEKNLPDNKQTFYAFEE